MLTAKNIKLLLAFISFAGIVFLGVYNKDLMYRLNWMYLSVWVVIGVLSLINNYKSQKDYEKNFIFTIINISLLSGCAYLLGDAIYLTWHYVINMDKSMLEIDDMLEESSLNSICFQYGIIGSSLIILFLYTAIFSKKQ